MIKKYTSILLLIGMMLLVACRSNNYHSIDVDDAVPVSVLRFDSVLIDYMSLTDTNTQVELSSSYGYYWQIYNQMVLGLSDKPLYCDGISRFLDDEVVSEIYKDAQREFADMSAECNALSDLTARFTTLFPHIEVPKFYAHISGLGKAIFTLDNIISVSLDCYLGADYALYKERYHNFELSQHERSRIIPDVCEVLLRNNLDKSESTTLLDCILYEGRILYLMSVLLDDSTSETLMGYTPQQSQWCEDNEERVWAVLVEHSHLFTSNNLIISKLVHPAPFTSLISPDSPGRIGRWVGWQIYKEYVRNAGLSLDDVVNDKAHSIYILEQSGYNGK